VLKRASEKPAGGRQIPLLRDQDVDDLAELVDGAVQGGRPTAQRS